MIRHPLWWVIGCTSALLLSVLLANEKEATQNDATIRFSERLISDKYSYAYGLAAADLDGDVDIVATAWAQGDRVVWFENHGDPRGKWTLHVLKENWKAANQVIVADLNGDKRPDIAARATMVPDMRPAPWSCAGGETKAASAPNDTSTP